MWFTRVSIGNPVMAVMVMLAFVVLGVFSAHRRAPVPVADVQPEMLKERVQQLLTA